jgi:hypothetical protein
MPVDRPIHIVSSTNHAQINRVYPIMKQLRPHISDNIEEFAGQVKEQYEVRKILGFGGTGQQPGLDSA